MAALTLSAHDINILEKIKDPESDPLQRVHIDASVPRDPHVSDPAVYQCIVAKELHVIKSLQEAEIALHGPGTSGPSYDPKERYREAVSRLGHLIVQHPQYASLRNNRAQALRRLYGDSMLVDVPSDAHALIQAPSREERHQCASTALSDLDTCIKLLTPETPQTPISQQAARTLAAAHTQRAAIYHRTGNLLGDGSHVGIDADTPGLGDRTRWTRLELQEAASTDFACGGRYGNEIAKALAVGVNPTAKLCGEIVKEAMEQEYGEFVR